MPSGLWRQHGKFSLALWEDGGAGADGAAGAGGTAGFDDDAAAAAGTVELVRDYLAAFGPATREDLAAFTFLRYHQLDPALAALEPRRLTDARGRELYDLPRAPLPREEELPAPPIRFLPKWDAALISHRDRTRILPPGFAEIVKGGKNGEVEATWLVDGQVAGIWRHEERGGRRDADAALADRRRRRAGAGGGGPAPARLPSPEAERRELALST